MLGACKTLTKNITFLEMELNYILNAIRFTKLKPTTTHDFVITTKDLFTALQQLSTELTKDVFPFTHFFGNILYILDTIYLAEYRNQ